MNAKTQMAFRVRNAAEDTLELDIYDIVGDSWFGGLSAKDVREKLSAAQGVRKINVRINSAGGDVFDGFAIYNLLAAHKARVTVDIDGLAASIASVIAMAGDKIRIASNAMMMVHNPWTIAMGDAAEMRDQADFLDKVGQQIASTYVARTGAAPDQVKAWMDAETWFTADEALDAGFVTQVTPAKQAAAAWDVSRFKNTPEDIARAAQQARAEAAPPPKPQDKSAADVGGPTENDMPDFEADLKKAQDQLAQANAAIATLTSERDSARAEAQTLKLASAAALQAMGVKDESVTLGQAVDALLKRTSDAEDKALDIELDQLVGDKITPAERAPMRALAKSDRAAFDALLEARPPLNLVGGRIAVDKADPNDERASAESDAGDDLSAAAEQRARGAA